VSDYTLDDRAIGVESPAEAKDLSSSLCVQSNSVVHAALYPMGEYLALSPGVKHGQGVILTTHPHLVLRSRMSRSYTSCPPCCLHGSAGTALLSTLLHQDTNVSSMFGSHQSINITLYITRLYQRERVSRKLENASGGILLILYSSVNTVRAFLISHFDSSKHLK
jgi:hypothetical protein